MIKFFDMFSGVGGFRAGLERAGGYECVGRCEIDWHADRAYQSIFKVKESEVFYEDATKIDTSTLPEFDLLCAGFPCQSFSIAGKRKGFSDERGTMFFEVARVARSRRPAYLLLENVPGLLSHDKGRTFAAILDTLCGLGYGVEWQVLNSKDFGVPQNRRRVYIVGYLDRECAGKVFPIRGANAKTLIQLVDGGQDSRVYDTHGLAKTLLANSGGTGGKTGLYAVGYNRRDGIRGEIDIAYALNASNHRGLNRGQTQNAVVSGTFLIKEATTRGYKKASTGDSVSLGFTGRNTRRGRVGIGFAHTLDTGGSQGVVTLNGRIRRLTPRECFRLQGFADEQIDRLLENSSDTQAYKQAGNAVTVNVVHALALCLKSAHEAAARQQTRDRRRHEMDQNNLGRPAASGYVRVVPELCDKPDIEKLAKAFIAIAKTLAEKKKAEEQALNKNTGRREREGDMT